VKALFYFILGLYEDIFIRSYVKWYILKYFDECMKIYI